MRKKSPLIPSRGLRDIAAETAGAVPSKAKDKRNKSCAATNVRNQATGRKPSESAITVRSVFVSNIPRLLRTRSQ